MHGRLADGALTVESPAVRATDPLAGPVLERTSMHHLRIRRPLRVLAALALVPLAAGLAACGGDSASGSSSGPPDELRLGYFANVTHAAALIGVQQGFIADELGDTKLT